MSRHKWSKGDRIVALYLYKYGVPSLGDPIALGNLLGMGPSSLVARLSNYLAVASNSEAGLKNFPREDEEIYRRYGLLERSELERMAKAHIARVATLTGRQ